MKKSLLAGFIFAVCLIANAQTNVSGFISANTTWNLAGSPYIVIGNALVSHGYTLTIEPGVVVKFETDKALQIDGELHAVGAAQNRITFTSNQITPAPGDWASIHFPDTCVDATLDANGNYVSGSIMKYCDVLYGGGLGFGEIHIEVSSPYFNNCNILNSESAGIYAHITSCWIDSCSFKDCHGYGLDMDRISTDINNVCFRYNTIENNSGGGINLGPNGGTHYLKLSNNYFEANHGFGVLFLSDISHPNVIIEENIFFSNSATNIVIGDYLVNNSINCNKFINNTGRTLGLFGGNWYEGTISNNLFEGNNSQDDLIIIDNITAYSPTYFYNNIIRNNTAAKNCLHMIPQLGNQQFTWISNNDFSNNTANNTILFDPIQAISGSYDFLYMKRNNFSNPLVQYEIYNDIPYGSANVYIDSNYWGGNNTAHIDSVVYDYFDFANQSVVYYMPILTKLVDIDTTCPAFVFPTSINKIEEPHSNFILSPNPFSSSITLSADESIIGSPVTVTDVTGRVVSQFKISNSKFQINTANWSTGVYFLQVVTGGERSVRQLVKQ